MSRSAAPPPRHAGPPGPTASGGGAPTGGHRPEPGTPAAGTPVTGAPAPRPSDGPRPPAPVPAPSSGPIRPPDGSTGLPTYTLANRLADWRRARADGRAGLPSGSSGTPTLEELAQDFLARSHRERLRLDVELAPLLETEAALGVRITETAEAWRRAEERVASWPALLESDQLGLRRGGESLTADDVVRARRAREYEALRRPMVEEVTRLQRAGAAAREELARVRAAIRAREVVGATRVRRIHAQAMARISAYERHLVRHHPRRDAIGPWLVAQHPRIPGWVFDAETGGSPSSGSPEES
ncbi:hypothetical protein GCM10023201_25140 [Actinomycetospora corticicola]|uniref:Uncharacterized protein n=1 Tax=Actinomycetospora corticicola TaxID=663602 RepID=A0A7Y9DXW3_9PSEU|nr:hypothetical protein [Actinomycetospora corticicola]NYD37351.1 hypothetical protein [Actinomycetospora corticicola]